MAQYTGVASYLITPCLQAVVKNLPYSRDSPYHAVPPLRCWTQEDSKVLTPHCAVSFPCASRKDKVYSKRPHTHVTGKPLRWNPAMAPLQQRAQEAAHADAETQKTPHGRGTRQKAAARRCRGPRRRRDSFPRFFPGLLTCGGVSTKSA
jgi:hypothetical protein